MKFVRKPIELLDPGKAFTDGGKSLGLTAINYWQYQFSNVWDDLMCLN